MTGPLARDALKIVVDGEEVPGLIAYGLAAPTAHQGGPFPQVGWSTSPEPQSFVLHGNGWRIFAWEIELDIWPTGERFRAALDHTLDALIRGGCRVAWIDSEGTPFCDPPGLFDPECMAGAVLAWMTDDGRFDCPLDPDRPVTPVGDAVLMGLRAHCRGLADADGSNE